MHSLINCLDDRGTQKSKKCCQVGQVTSAKHDDVVPGSSGCHFLMGFLTLWAPAVQNQTGSVLTCRHGPGRRRLQLCAVCPGMCWHQTGTCKPQAQVTEQADVLRPYHTLTVAGYNELRGIQCAFFCDILLIHGVFCLELHWRWVLLASVRAGPQKYTPRFWSVLF